MNIRCPALADRLLLPLIILAVGVLTGCDDPSLRPASWSYVHAAIIEPSCATSSCHSRPAVTSGLRFDDADLAYDALIEGQFVLPGDPSSPLMFILAGNERDRMPPDAPLPRADVALIRAWIESGATR